MTRRRNQHVVRSDNGQWAVKGENALRPTNLYNTPAEAIAIAKEIAKNQKSELFIHGKDGTIRERNSYGSDPFPPRG